MRSMYNPFISDSLALLDYALIHVFKIVLKCSLATYHVAAIVNVTYNVTFTQRNVKCNLA